MTMPMYCQREREQRTVFRYIVLPMLIYGVACLLVGIGLVAATRLPMGRSECAVNTLTVSCGSVRR